MKHFSAIFALILFSCVVANGQAFSVTAADAFTISRMAAKFHVQPRPVDKSFSADWFDDLVHALDEDRIFFTQEDISKLLPYRQQLDEELLLRRTGCLQSLTDIFARRVSQADSMIDNLSRQPFSFAGHEKFSVAEDTSRPANTAAMRRKLQKLLMAATLNRMLEREDKSAVPAADIKKKSADSLEITARKKAQAFLKRVTGRIIHNPGGIQAVVANAYCQTLAACYDPHTDFFSATAKENFEGSLGNTQLRFGLRLGEDDNGEAIIAQLKPGSPAFKSGQLNKGDKLITLQWQGQDPIDVSGAGVMEIGEMLNASNHQQLTITVKKSDGTLSQATLVKEQSTETDDENDNKVKSFLLKGSRTLGYIVLPAFYTDWEAGGSTGTSCADDVAKEILRLKKENIQGLILDLRYNGGGSMEEATELTGIFIDAGPVGQVKQRETKVMTLKDVNRGSVYEGPLLVLVNGYSASASEMVAGALQDYNRALIVGSPTYGKATMQVLLPLDTNVRAEGNYAVKPADNYLKLTTGKLYRITGSSAQRSGVQPDIRLPDFSELDPRKENNAPHALMATPIEANRYYKAYPALPIASLQAMARARTDTAVYFTALRSYMDGYRRQVQAKDATLNWAEAVKESKKENGSSPPLPQRNRTGAFAVSHVASTEQRIKSDAALSAQEDLRKGFLLEDPYLLIAYYLLTAPAAGSSK